MNNRTRILMQSLFLLFTVFSVLFISTIPAYASTVDPPLDTSETGLIAFIKGLFIPSDNYFTNQFQRLNDRFSEKMGGLGLLFGSIQNFFSSLGTLSTSSLSFALPDNYFFSGYKGININFLDSISVYVNLIRNVFNVVVCLLTSFCCYKKIVTFLE